MGGIPVTGKDPLEENRFNDRELLILIAERQRVQGDSLSKVVKDLGEVAARVTVLEKASERQSGFLGGVKSLWAFVLTLPLGVVAGFFGGKQVN